MLFPALLVGLVGGLIGYAVSRSQEKKANILPNPKQLPPIQIEVLTPQIVSRVPGRTPGGKKAVSASLVATVKKALASRDPRQFRAAAVIAERQGSPQTAVELAKLADQRAREIATEGVALRTRAEATGDPALYERYAALMLQINNKVEAVAARRMSIGLRKRRAS